VSLSVLDRYSVLVERGTLEHDEGQAFVLQKLELLRRDLSGWISPRKASSLGRLFSSKSTGAKGTGTRGTGAKGMPIAPRGLYLWGSVGRGKTMLMDLFFEAARIESKRRAHFHAFMTQTHARIHSWRQELKRKGGDAQDPIAFVADEIATSAQLLCFDEFCVTDIVDAMLLGRLFSALFERGVVIVATSNVEPRRLYENGLNRALFLPFIDLIEARMEVVRLDARTDFRLEKLQGRIVYHVPANAKATHALTAAFTALTGVEHGAPLDLDLLGRKLHVPEACANVARIPYADLCKQPLGAADFLALAQAFHTIVIDAIEVIPAACRNEAKRFITLVDTLYDSHVKLVASAEAEPEALYLGTEGHEAFEFARTASRLIEMRSEAYLALPHGPVGSYGSGNASGLVET
jgi:cell division protein ZapE